MLRTRNILDMYGNLLYIYLCTAFCRTVNKKGGTMGQASAAKRTERLDARVTRDEKVTIETAARLRGTSVTDFLVMSAREAALRTIRENEVLTLAERSRRAFVEALLHPPKPNPKALAAARRLKREIG